MPPFLPCLLTSRVSGWATAAAALLAGAVSFNGVAQHYPAVRVQAVADSLLRQQVGPALWAQSHYQARTFYYTRHGSGKERYRALLAGRKTTGRLRRLEVRYTLHLTPSGCEAVDTLTGPVLVALDARLHLVEAPTLAFVPDFLWRGEPCALLGRARALALAQADSLQPGLGPPTALLAYHPTTKAFTWSVFNYLTRDSRHPYPTGTVEVVDINAATGQVLQHQTRWHGPMR
ncbi:hypothetical protein [Hymenobacter nivis]|uniref:FTP domain-containing protein n=1 Tax=Hymenobacter nivis TaxID=1850093 RepID=A0A502GAG5_9BACT|nr:hypothetical protein [Hymenobacter nivis]TPG58016.1 hypothetical protein EAH73_22750 [Hymenobacter nivis]